MIFAEGALGVILIGFLLFCLLDVITTDAGDIRNLPKLVWILLVLLNPIGGIAWLLAGRPQQGAAGGRLGGLPSRGSTGRAQPTQRTAGLPGFERPRQPTAPDDDPEFLAEINRNVAEHERMLGSWEDDLRRREEELRRQRGEDGGAS